MSYRRLGRTALKVGPLAVGTVNFGWLADEAESFAMLNRAREHGINMIDTADAYNAGRSEELVGRYIAKEANREEIVLATKCYLPPADYGSKDPVKRSGSWVGPNQRGLSAKHIVEACEASLRRLNVEYIDLYQMHHVDRNAPWEEVWQAFERLVQQGKVIYVGSSNFAGWQIAQACERARERHFLGPVSEQSVYNLMQRTVELEVMPACRAYGLGFIPYSPLGTGLLAAAGGTQEGVRSKNRLKNATEDEQAKVRAFGELCREIGEKPAEVAIAFVASNPDVTCPIIGPRTMAQLESALHAVQMSLDDDIKARLDEIFPGPGGEAPEAYAW